MNSLETAWGDVIANLDGPASIDALVRVLDKLDALDAIKQRVLAEAAAELRADVADVTRVTQGKLGQAVALIEAGAAKEVVLAKVSRRTYYRARRECQECQATSSHRSRLVGSEAE